MECYENYEREIMDGVFVMLVSVCPLSVVVLLPQLLAFGDDKVLIFIFNRILC